MAASAENSDILGLERSHKQLSAGGLVTDPDLKVCAPVLC